MITQEGYDQVSGVGVQISHKDFMELVGLSTDSKPTFVANGSTFFEMDTKKVFIYDGENYIWREL